MAKSFSEIPLLPPDTPLLDLVDTPGDLRDFSEKQLLDLADELREFLLFSVGQTGGHFGAGLGVVELTVACTLPITRLKIESFGMLDIKPILTKSSPVAGTKWIQCEKKEVFQDSQNAVKANMTLLVSDTQARLSVQHLE